MNVSTKNDLQVYKIRWLFLASFCLIFYWLLFNICLYGVVNNVLIEYFNVSYTATDWLVLSSVLGTAITSPVLAWLSFKELISCRKLVYVACLCIMCDSICSILGFQFPNLFGLMLFGQILNGVAMGVSLTLMTSLAELWFPESQIGIATALVILSASLGSLIANTLVPAIVQGANYSLKHSTVGPTFFHPAFSNQTTSNASSSWKNHNRIVFQVILSTELLTTTIALIFTLVFIPEKPDKPPSYAQHLKRSTDYSSNFAFNRTRTVAEFWNETKRLLTDKVFLSYSISSGIIFDAIDLEIVIMQQVIYDNFKSTLLLPRDLQAGLVITWFNVGSMIGNLVSGRLLDRFKQYYIQSCVGSACFTLFTVGALLSVYYRYVATLFLSYFLAGVFSRIGLISVIDALMQHVFPRNVLFVSSWMAFLQNLFALIIVEIGRVIFERMSLIGTLTFVCVMKFVSFLLCVLFEPKTLRFSVENSQASNSTFEETPLINNQS